MKFSIVSKAAVPDVSLIDPETTLRMDPFLSACTGIDALVHAIEAFVSTGHGPLTDPPALEATRLTNGHLAQTIGRASSRERVCQSVYIAVVDVLLKKQYNQIDDTKRNKQKI